MSLSLPYSGWPNIKNHFQAVPLQKHTHTLRTQKQTVSMCRKGSVAAGRSCEKWRMEGEKRGGIENFGTIRHRIWSLATRWQWQLRQTITGRGGLERKYNAVQHIEIQEIAILQKMYQEIRRFFLHTSLPCRLPSNAYTAAPPTKQPSISSYFNSSKILFLPPQERIGD